MNPIVASVINLIGDAIKLISFDMNEEAARALRKAANQLDEIS